MAMLKAKHSVVRRQRRHQKVHSKSCEVYAIDGSWSGFTIALTEECQLPESELFLADVGRVFLESRVHSERQRSDCQLAGCHGNSHGRSLLLDERNQLRRESLCLLDDSRGELCC